MRDYREEGRSYRITRFKNTVQRHARPRPIQRFKIQYARGRYIWRFFFLLEFVEMVELVTSLHYSTRRMSFAFSAISQPRRWLHG